MMIFICRLCLPFGSEVTIDNCYTASQKVISDSLNIDLIPGDIRRVRNVTITFWNNKVDSYLTISHGLFDDIVHPMIYV